jgi:hypothetical protein
MMEGDLLPVCDVLLMSPMFALTKRKEKTPLVVMTQPA